MKTEDHLHKYRNFKKEAERSRYPPSKIENYFLACFHLIEAKVFSKAGVHIHKHQRVRSALEKKRFIFGKDTRRLWSSFQDLENKVRIATSYGKKDNGKLLEEAKEIFERIERMCRDVLEV